jgi:hypothetical protein
MKTGVCPYPGLRPFTEEESIFFKGRDLHIRQIVKLLEQNKMAFITGASGDGKSSIVYAGVVPYIRAGFSKAEFNSWLVFDFKPQRNPLASLAESAAKEMQLSYNDTLAEMRRGFSALIKLYKKSGFYVREGADAKNRGKNLLIIADQFEEIFTMNENFYNGTPSNFSYTCVNILLETVRLSIDEQLPVYVIFTMRSDFISQCTVFKDLPEFIAYSQFFVPQLKRTEIRQVIEQPALLAGGSVSTRLTEVLINNLNSGFDQLPVLQHALNLLWKTAGNGSVPLDLPHLAKIAGISREMLDNSERSEFNRWFEKLPSYQKKYYEKPDLNNVLNAHAGMLYESAYDYFIQNVSWAKNKISPEESKLIIEIAFKTLTKIDNNRQVRNRATLHEITGIINRPNITEAEVCGVLNIFRDENNTLLRPFAVTGQLDTQYLSGGTILDVTHEALIRNWKLLSQWDLEELENLKEYNEFNSQVQRWIDNGRSPEFLLTSGNYAIFRQWYERCKPNQYWILKHDNSQRPALDKFHAAASRMEKCGTFMDQSRDAIAAKEKSRRRKIAMTIIGLLVFIAGLSVFSLWAMNEKKNAENEKKNAIEQQRIAEEQKSIAEQQKIIADEQRRSAEAANETAEQQRDSARLMYRRAMEAKLESDRARRQAEESQQTAEKERRNAEENFRLAEHQRESAERERQNAIKANDNAERLYFVALCNTLAMKTKNSYEDKNLNLRLAKTACEMNRKGGGDFSKNADLYDAMLFAMEQNKIIQPLDIPADMLKTFAVDDAGCIVVLDGGGSVSRYRIRSDGKNQRAGKSINITDDKAPVESAFFLTPSITVCSAKDKKSFLVSLADGRKTELPFCGDYIRAASMSPEKKNFVAAYINGNVAVMPLNSEKPVAQKNFQTKITDVYFPDDGNVYILCHNGNLLKWNFQADKVENVLHSEGGRIAFKMTPVTDKNLLAVCYSDGEILLVSLKDFQKVKTVPVGHSKLENLLYDPNTGLLALASADKRISLVNTADFDQRPLVIEEHCLENHKVKCMAFNGKGVLFALTDDNKVRFWDTSPDVYANALLEMSLAPLTDTEWNQILGREFSEK